MNIKKIIPYFLVFFLCAVDIFLAALYEEPILHGVVIVYFIWLFTKPVFLPLFVALAAIALESFLYHDKFGTGLLILLPLTALSFSLKKYFNFPKLGPLVALTCYLVLYWVILEPWCLGIPSLERYTLAKIAVNLLVMTLFLKF